ncbi:hypothetical protein MP228_011892 [Amoeboaphelidium protococcarum]|nr:hypothetical protein MP228_011892 [Amoeboaphelidium protococcarum]
MFKARKSKGNIRKKTAGGDSLQTEAPIGADDIDSTQSQQTEQQVITRIKLKSLSVEKRLGLTFNSHSANRNDVIIKDDDNSEQQRQIDTFESSDRILNLDELDEMDLEDNDALNDQQSRVDESDRDSEVQEWENEQIRKGTLFNNNNNYNQPASGIPGPSQRSIKTLHKVRVMPTKLRPFAEIMDKLNLSAQIQEQQELIQSLQQKLASIDYQIESRQEEVKHLNSLLQQ